MAIEIYNSTPIRDDVIELIYRVVMPKDIPEIISITLRNKQMDMIHGNWGKFYPVDYTITLCVPRIIKEYSASRLVTRIPFTFKDELDFLAAVIGHECYHAWQWIHEKHLWHCKEYLEVGAELYEDKAVEKWIEFNKKSNVAKIHKDKPILYRDYR